MYSILILNGGVGTRVGLEKPKQLIKVHGIPLLVYSLVAVKSIKSINQIIINYPKGWKNEIKEILESYPIKKEIILIEAESSRHKSVYAMLQHVKNDSILIHESARPLVTKDDFEKILSHPSENVSYMIEIPFTVAPVDPENKKITGFLERNKLRNVQLPQKFRKKDIIYSHKRAKEEGLEFTEDATLVSHYNHSVSFTNGKDSNIKITTPIDITIATQILKER